MNKLFLTMTFHGHQPAGNRPEIVEQAISKCYRPLLESLRAHPGIRFCLHLSGALIQWLDELAPELLDLLRDLSDRKQVELLGGGLHDPILATLPEADAMAQLSNMNDLIRTRFGQTCRGAWIAERVWEPHLASLLHRAGLAFTLLDDSILRQGGRDLLRGAGHQMTDHAGEPLAVFPIDRTLRHSLPGLAPGELLEELRSLAEKADSEKLLCFADDWEKFGFWPGSHEGVWERAWFENFLSALDAAVDWLQTCTLSGWMAGHPAAGRAYPAAASYEELQSWSLDVGLARQIQELAPSSSLRLGHWRNFLVKYPEANRLYRKMLAVSRKLAEARGESDADDASWLAAQDELLKGQDHAALWHGMFAGIYSPLLRQAQYAHLLKAECLLDQMAQGDDDWIAFDELDYDGDGRDELLIENRLLNVLISPARGGRVIAIEHRPSLRCPSDVMAAHQEVYHDPAALNIQMVRERNNFIDRFAPLGSTLEDRMQAHLFEEGDFADGPFSVEKAGIDEEGDCDFEAVLFRAGHLRRAERDIPLEMIKRFRLPADRAEIEVQISLRNPSDTALDFQYCPEFNLASDAGGLSRVEFDGMAGPGPHASSAGELTEATWLALSQAEAGIRIRLSAQPDGTIWRYPVETRVRSEQGMETIDQGLALGACWEMTLPPKAERTFWLRLSIQNLATDDLTPLPPTAGPA